MPRGTISSVNCTHGEIMKESFQLKQNNKTTSRVATAVTVSQTIRKVRHESIDIGKNSLKIFTYRRARYHGHLMLLLIIIHTYSLTVHYESINTNEYQNSMHSMHASDYGTVTILE